MDIIILFFIAVLIYLLPMNDDYLGVKTTLGLKGFGSIIFRVDGNFPSTLF